MKKIFLTISFVFLLGLSGCNLFSSTEDDSPQPPIVCCTPNPDIPTGISTSTPVVPVVPAPVGTPVALFTETLSKVDAQNRGWPTDRVWKQVRGQEKTVLVDSIGKVGEFPNSYEVSPDLKMLYINLETKLVQVDIETGEQKTIFTPKNRVNNLIFSQDGKKMFIWDQVYASPTNFNFALHELDLATGQSKMLANGDTEGKYMFIQGVRDGNIAILSQAMGEASQPWYLDLASNKLKSIPGMDAGYFIMNSRTGNFFLTQSKWVNDACNDFWGKEGSVTDIHDSVTGIVAKQVGEAGKAIRIKAVSPNDSEIIYGTAAPRITAENCDESARIWNYYSTKLSGNEPPVALTTLQVAELERTWDPYKIYEARHTENGTDIYEGIKKIFHLDPKHQLIRVL